MGWIRCVRCENIRRNFMARSFALIASVQSISHWVYCRNKIIPNAPRHQEMQQKMNFRSNGGDSMRSLWNIRRDFVARTFALNAPVQPILHRVSCSNEMVPNAPKHYEMHQNMSLGSNGVDQVHSLRKIQTRLRGMNFCIICTNSVHFAPSFMH